MTHRYDDIINLPHHVSQKHAPMARADRAAQFSPFAALTGLDAALRETARLTDQRITLDEYEQAALDETLQAVRDALTKKEHPTVEVCYFVPDTRKAGGAYCLSLIHIYGNEVFEDVEERCYPEYESIKAICKRTGRSYQDVTRQVLRELAENKED